MKKSSLILAAAGVATALAGTFAPSAMAATKACFIYVGPTGDFGLELPTR